MNEQVTIQKILSIYASETHKNTVISAEKSGRIPKATRIGSNKRRVWSYDQIPQLGEKYGFLRHIDNPVVIVIYSLKGGTHKSTTAMNLARMIALHNIQTAVVGLDQQCDVSGDLGIDLSISEDEELDDVLEKLKDIYGLYDMFQGKIDLNNLLMDTDLPSLRFIPETPGLGNLEREIHAMPAREYWLKNNVIDPLKKQFQVIILDCAPSWNNLTANAVMASDLLVSPLECKIKHFRNYPQFKIQIDRFLDATRKDIRHVFMTTKLKKTKLSQGIQDWYFKHLNNCIKTTVRESSVVEDACLSLLSVPEFKPSHETAVEMRSLVREIWNHAVDISKNKDLHLTALN